MAGLWIKDQTFEIVHTGLNHHIHFIATGSSGNAHVTVPMQILWTLKTVQIKDREVAVHVLPAEKAREPKMKTYHSYF